MGAESTSLTLLQRARQHDAQAWDHLLYIYTPLLQHWCQRAGLTGPDAEDVRQEVFQAVARKLDSFRRDRPGDTFRGWLRTITQSKIIDLQRRRQRQPEARGGAGAYRAIQDLPAPVVLAEEDAPEEIQLLHRRALDLVRAQFEAQTWQAFWRCAVEGQAPAEIARDLGVSPAAVRQSKSRVLRRLKEQLGEILG